jgi:alkylation response protein AidB-like acyl-CoA dehydrogenase
LTLVASEEQEQLRQSVRRFCERQCPSARLRELISSEKGYDPAAWTQMADQLGLQSLAVPAEYGGMGYGLSELVIVLEEMGRVLFPGPFLATSLLATSALLAAEDETAKAELLPRLADGTARGTIACVAPTGDWTAPAAVQAAHRNGDWSLTGTAGYVIEGLMADIMLVFANTDDGEALFHVDPAEARVTRTPLTSLDPTRRLTTVEFDAASGWLLSTPGNGHRIRSATMDRAAVGLAAELIGVGQRSLDMAVDYVKNRYQFGRPVGSFQAIKHMAAQMAVTLEGARSLVEYAVAATGTDDFPAAACLAKAYTGAGVFSITADAIQMHGGLGFTSEYDLQLYYKRTKSSQLMFGDELYHRELMLQRVGL